jgi:hypothetical protein
MLTPRFALALSSLCSGITKQRPLIAICLGSAAAAFFSTLPSDAQAVEKRLHGSICHAINEPTAPELENASLGVPYEGEKGITYRNQSNIFVTLLCPIDEDPDLVRTSIVAATMYGRLGDKFIGLEGINVKACRSNSTSDGGVCGFFNSASSLGNYAIAPELTSAWSTTTGFAYLSVRMTAADDTVRGIHLSN